MAHRGIIGPALKMVVIAVVIFFVLYFLVPESAERFFGTSVRDSRAAQSAGEAAGELSDADLQSAADAVAAYISSIDPSVTAEQAKQLLSSPEARSLLEEVQEAGNAVIPQVAESIIGFFGENGQQ